MFAIAHSALLIFDFKHTFQTHPNEFSPHRPVYHFPAPPLLISLFIQKSKIINHQSSIKPKNI
jgi:hypothetical protein